ncbi:MAG TPA: mechanosensitive ion channel family protein [Candidatus Binataceae bacterium]
MHPLPTETHLGTLLMLDSLPHHMRSPVELIAAVSIVLIAFALRRRKWMLSTTSLLMLANGLFLDLIAHSARAFPSLEEVFSALGLLLFACALIRIVMEVIEAFMRRRSPHFSTIFNDLLMWILFFGVLFAILHTDFGLELSTIGVGSLGVGAIIGLAAQETLGNIFSGLGLSLQQPFNPGDWVRAGEHLGRVEGVGIRATTVITRANERLAIPNSLVAKDVLTNYRGAIGDEVSVGLSYDVPPNEVREVILHVLRDIPHVLAEPHPEVFAWEYGDFAIRYRVKYFIRDWGAQEFVRDSVVSSLWYALRRHSIEIPYPIRSVQRRQPPPRIGAAETEFQREIIRELHQVEWLKELNDEELRVLTPSVQVREFGKGEVLMRQGEPGETVFIIRRGTVEVLLRRPDGKEHRVNQLGRAACIGEMSVLTGEARTATIRALADTEVLEMNRDGFMKLFKEHPEAATAISEIVQTRQAQNEAAYRQTDGEDQQRGSHRWVFDKIKEIFDL